MDATNYSSNATTLIVNAKDLIVKDIAYYNDAIYSFAADIGSLIADKACFNKDKSFITKVLSCFIFQKA